ncbi:Metalloenzyme, LuxS/M16 peptidase-like protein [Lipomyces japonicus]|uniref:Metalloenzyme, LuxS/M16 peptidase-like protein n=1 Tax=Lipomyces japonicus TaxID=56871 RepID=UPI0034CD9BBB
MPPFSVIASDLERPELDNRSYRVIKLENELEALLIHDPDTDKASAALDVNVGSFSDPKELQGLAHFCEHLLFMGTEKYPKENDYSEYLSSHAGHSNAYTDSNDTNYYFEVGHEFLEGALDRFAQFFIAPLFSADGKDREIRAVDSENKKNLQSDNWRLHQLDRSLSNPDHPYSNFSTGNLETLEYNPTNLGIDVRDELLKFHKKYYSANIMKLVVLGRESLDELQDWAVEKFSAVGNSQIDPPRFKGHPLTEKELQKQIFAKPVMDEKALDLTFIFPDQRPLYKSHPSHYYSHLIGHEGPGSILEYLKSQSWANGLSAGSSHISDGAEIFNISVDLTTEGLKQYEKVIVTVFQYLQLLQQTDPQQWVYEELRDVAASNFRFRQKSPASSTTSRLAAIMQNPLPREWLLSGPTLYREFDAKEIAESAKYFDPEAFRFTLISQEHPGDWNKTEKWYGTEYKIENISKQLLSELKNIPVNDELYLPAKNEFIATNFEVEKKEVETPSKNPVLLRNTEGLKLWFKKDDTFWVPKANVYIALRNPLANATPANNIKTRLIVDLISDSLSAYTYAANIAGLNYRFGMSSEGLYIGTDGYNHKMVTLLRKILEEIRDFKVSAKRFKVIKEKLLREYKNFDYTVPYHQIGYYTSYLFSEKIWLNEEKISELESTNWEDVQNFIPELLNQFDSEVLVHGNLVKDDALIISKLVDETLKHKSLPKSLKILPRSLILPEAGQYSFKRENKDSKNLNSCIEYYTQIGEISNERQRVVLSLLAQIGSEPAFNQLRTKEQLGYVVFSGVRQTRTQTGYRVLIQSEKTSEYLESRVDNYFGVLKKFIENLSDEEFQKHVKSLINKRLEKLKNLSEETNRYWNHIQSGYYDFYRNTNEATLLPLITKDEVLELFNEYVHPSSKTRSKVIVELKSQCAPPLPELSQIIKSNIGEFWKINELPVDKVPSDEQIKKLASDDAIDGFKEYFSGIGQEGAWEKFGLEFVQQQVKLSQEPVPNPEQVGIADVTIFKAALQVSAAPSPVTDLSTFKVLDAKL